MVASRAGVSDSQIDLAPTLLSIIGVSSCHPLIGRDFMADPTSPGRALLQFDDHFALMGSGKITLLKPDETAVIATYNKTTKHLLLGRVANTDEQRRALAQVQLPSYLYRESKYGLGTDCVAAVNENSSEKTIQKKQHRKKLHYPLIKKRICMQIRKNQKGHRERNRKGITA